MSSSSGPARSTTPPRTIAYADASGVGPAASSRKQVAPAADRNKAVIAEVLARFLAPEHHTADGPGAVLTLLEIASGTGQHAAYFTCLPRGDAGAAAAPHSSPSSPSSSSAGGGLAPWLVVQPTDTDAAAIESIAAYREEAVRLEGDREAGEAGQAGAGSAAAGGQDDAGSAPGGGGDGVVGGAVSIPPPSIAKRFLPPLHLDVVAEARAYAFLSSASLSSSSSSSSSSSLLSADAAGAAPAAAAPAVVVTEAGSYDAVLCANMIHIAPPECTPALIDVAARALGSGVGFGEGGGDDGGPRLARARTRRRGLFFLYGPFLVDGRPTTESNAAFDLKLRGMNPSFGLRDAADVARLALERGGLSLRERVEMPANNFMLVFETA